MPATQCSERSPWAIASVFQAPNLRSNIKQIGCLTFSYIIKLSIIKLRNMLESPTIPKWESSQKANLSEELEKGSLAGRVWNANPLLSSSFLCECGQAGFLVCEQTWIRAKAISTAVCLQSNLDDNRKKKLPHLERKTARPVTWASCLPVLLKWLKDDLFIQKIKDFVLHWLDLVIF